MQSGGQKGSSGLQPADSPNPPGPLRVDSLPGIQGLHGADVGSPHHHHCPCTVSHAPTAPHFWSSLHVSSKPQNRRLHQTREGKKEGLHSFLPLLLKTIIFLADNEDRTTIQKKTCVFGDSGHVSTTPAGFLFLGLRALAALHLPQASSLPFSHIPCAGCAGPGLLHILLCL